MHRRGAGNRIAEPEAMRSLVGSVSAVLDARLSRDERVRIAATTTIEFVGHPPRASGRREIAASRAPRPRTSSP